MLSTSDIQSIKETFPDYLSKPLQEKLLSEISSDFPLSADPKKMYGSYEDESFIQGDGLIDAVFPKLEEGEFVKKYFNGLIISNSCDIERKNKRLMPQNVSVATIYPLSTFLENLGENNISKTRINSFQSDLKGNRISNLFYLPELKVDESVLMEDSFVRFDELTSFSTELLNKHYATPSVINKGDKIFTLSQYGFYLLLYKLSVHFCRFREEISRDEIE